MLISGCLVILFASLANGANILAVIPAPFYSHQIAFQEIWKELSRRGHQVTLVTTVPPKDPTLVNLTVIDMSNTYRTVREKWTISKTAENILNMWNWYDIFAQINRDVTEHELSSPELQDLIHHHENYHFDVLFVESYYSEFLAFGKVYNCPTILVTSVDGHTEFHHAMGNPAHPILNADYATAYFVELSFRERIISTVFSWYVSFLETFYINPGKQKIIEKFFTNTSVTLNELIRNVDLLFLDCNPSIQGARAIGPTTINIGMERRLVNKNPLSKKLPENFHEVGDMCITEEKVALYLFKKALLEDDIARQETLEKREQKEKVMAVENLKWEHEDFGPDIELTEEEQITLLQQYEEEKRKEKSSPKSKRVVGGNTVFKQNSPKKNNTDGTKLNENDSAVSLDTPSSNSSTDGEWEKISYVEKEMK